jgi:thiol-disulfide isomerase/thioredoxin
MKNNFKRFAPVLFVIAGIASYFIIFHKPNLAQANNKTTSVEVFPPNKSVELSIGAAMPLKDQALKVTDGSTSKLSDVRKANGTVVVFWSNTCPWVSRYEARMAAVVDAYKEKGFGFIALNANDPVAYPEENLESMKAKSEDKHYPFVYAMDEGSKIATAFGAARTPHVFVFDKSDKLVYVGGIDSNPQEDAAAKPFLKNALDAIIAGQPVTENKTRAFGCTIKWQTEG